MFKGRKLLIATKHQKEKVIAPILERELGVICFTTDDFDTDKLGTFSGEIDRKDDPIITARNKCLLAMELANCDLVISSEGSFGPHPTIYFIPADDEFLILIDKKNNLEIIVRELSTETNFNGAEIKTEEELYAFAKNAQFPSHALIIKNTKNDFTHIIKGITNSEHLKDTFKDFISKYGKAYIETDMRAMYNPTRMKIIEKATVKLANKINSLCPNCDIPGFGITDAKQGLPCELCNFPTRSILSYLYVCKKCSYKKEEKYPNGKHFESPNYCDVCNP
ncbi:MAG: hypothetical protein H7331_05060 [Bacteroidia bacterium]|nr:hypothetical protein [Bacteroidia bacterium]